MSNPQPGTVKVADLKGAQPIADKVFDAVKDRQAQAKKQ